MICYNGDILEKLKKAGYSTYRLRMDKLLGESQIQRLRERKSVSFEVLDKICVLLDCDLSEILIHKREQK